MLRTGPDNADRPAAGVPLGYAAPPAWPGRRRWPFWVAVGLMALPAVPFAVVLLIGMWTAWWR